MEGKEEEAMENGGHRRVSSRKQLLTAITHVLLVGDDTRAHNLCVGTHRRYIVRLCSRTGKFVLVNYAWACKNASHVRGGKRYLEKISESSNKKLNETKKKKRKLRHD